MYCNINKIHYNEKFLEIPYTLIVNTHVLISISIKDINIHPNFQAFLDKKPIGVFDRVSVSKIYNKSRIIISCRLSKNYKNWDKLDLEKLYLPFLIEKNILNDSCKINDIYYFNYNCSYRGTNKNREHIL